MDRIGSAVNFTSDPIRRTLPIRSDPIRKIWPDRTDPVRSDPIRSQMARLIYAICMAMWKRCFWICGLPDKAIFNKSQVFVDFYACTYYIHILEVQSGRANRRVGPGRVEVSTRSDRCGFGQILYNFSIEQIQTVYKKTIFVKLPKGATVHAKAVWAHFMVPFQPPMKIAILGPICIALIHLSFMFFSLRASFGSKLSWLVCSGSGRVRVRLKTGRVGFDVVTHMRRNKKSCLKLKDFVTVVCTRVLY